MTIVFQERLSDSPYLQTVTRGITLADGSPTRPAELNWHMVIAKHKGKTQIVVVGPWTASGVVHYEADAEVLWIRFKLGTFMPHLPTRHFINSETILPSSSCNAFWLKSASWQFPDFENVETFVERLVHDDILVHDPVVDAVMQGHLQAVPSRTVRHRFLQATGHSQNHIRQHQRAQHAAALLAQGVSILDTVHEAGYFDQAHLTRSLKKFIGYTPSQHLIRLCQPG